MLKSIGKISVEVAAGKTLTVNNSLTFSGVAAGATTVYVTPGEGI